MLYGFNYMTIWKRQTMETNIYIYIYINAFQELVGAGGMSKQSTEDFQSSITILHDTTKPYYITTIIVIPNVNSGL